MTFYVYVLTSSKDDRVYVGMSQAPTVRFTAHRFASKSERGALYDAMRLHGVDSFDQEIIAGFPTRKEALDAEAALARTLRAENRELFNRTFLLGNAYGRPGKNNESRARRQMNPIAVRPRKGSALYVLFAECGFNNRVMADLIHHWAELAMADNKTWASQFAEMAAASEQGEKTND